MLYKDNAIKLALRHNDCEKKSTSIYIVIVLH